jgi:hypothetical protein
MNAFASTMLKSSQINPANVKTVYFIAPAYCAGDRRFFKLFRQPNCIAVNVVGFRLALQLPFCF